MTAQPLQCEHPDDNHSDDLIQVYRGEPEPYVLCGYHASWGRRAFDAVRDRRLAEHATVLDAIPDDLEDQ